MSSKMAKWAIYRDFASLSHLCDKLVQLVAVIRQAVQGLVQLVAVMRQAILEAFCNFFQKNFNCKLVLNAILSLFELSFPSFSRTLCYFLGQNDLT